MDKKQCKVCGETKTVDNYYKAKGGALGVGSLCIPCHNHRRRELYLTKTGEREREKQREWNKKNRDKRRGYIKKYRESLKGRALKTALERKRKACKVNATPDWLTPEQHDQMLALYVESATKTEETGVQHNVDHIVPLQGKNICGLHVPWNLQVITALENRKKGERYEE